MFWNLIVLEQQKIFRRAVFWIEAGILALMVLFVYIAAYAAVAGDLAGLESEQSAELVKMLLQWPEGLFSTLQFSGPAGFGALMVVVLVGAVTAQEYSWRTMHLWISKGIPRGSLAAGKFFALLTAVAGVALVPLLAGGIVTAVFTVLDHGFLDVTSVPWGELAVCVLRTIYALLPYAAFAFLLSIATRSPVGTVGIGLGYCLIVEGILAQILSLIGGLAANLAQLLPGMLTGALLTLNRGTEAAGHLEPGALVVVIGGIAVYIVVPVLAAAAVLQRQDLSG